MQRIVLTFGLILAISAVAFAQSAKPGPEIERAQGVLKQARAALGSEAKLQAIRSLSAVGKFRRTVSQRDVSGEIEFNLLLPDKYKKVETMIPAPSVSIASIDIINGENVTIDARTSGPGNVVFNRPGTGNASPQAKAAAQRAAREEFARMMISWLLISPSSFPTEFKYVGEAEAPDGRADMLEANGPDGFAAYLFLDKKTHLPLMLSYRGKSRRAALQTSDGTESQEALQQKIRDQLAKGSSGESEMQIRFSDYRAVNGVLFPHRITKAVGGEVNEEWEMSSYKVNPAFSSDKFEK